MKTSLKFKTAAVAIVATAFAISTPASAQYSNQYQNSNSGGQLLGAVIGGVAGAALGDGIAPRGQSSEYGIIGGVLGGVAGAAIAGSGNNQNRGYNSGYYNQQTGYYGSGYTTLDPVVFMAGIEDLEIAGLGIEASLPLSVFVTIAETTGAIMNAGADTNK